MSNRFHSKFHRQNHHTYTSATNPDAGHDPIASPEQPFRGDFVLSGALSCVAPASATAAYFSTNNTALCAIAGYRGIYVSSGPIGGEFLSTQATAISANGAFIGGDFYSPIRGVRSHGNTYGVDTYSPNIALNANGINVGGNFYSPTKALSAFSPNTGLDVGSPNLAINANSNGGVALKAFSTTTSISSNGTNIGIFSYSPNIALSVSSPLTGATIKGDSVSLSTNGNGVNILNNRTGIFKIPHSSYNGYAPSNIVLDVNGDVLIDGDTVITGSLTALGALTQLDTHVQVTSSLKVNNIGNDAAVTIVQTGAQPILACYDNDISLSVPSFLVDGASNGWVALGIATPTAPLTIQKSTASNQGNNQPQIRITDDGTTNKVSISTPITNFSRSYVGTESNTSFDIISNSSTRVTVLNTGNVGINETSPSAKLSVSGSISGNSTFTNVGDIAGNSKLTIDNDILGKTKLTAYGAISGRSTLNIDSTASIGNNLTVNGTISSSGNLTVGGTTATVNNLTVNGTISSSNTAIVTRLSAYDFVLNHPTPNDGINPSIFIGEMGDGSAGTIAGSLSGFITTYDELQNKYVVKTQFAAVTPLTALVIDQSANITAPNQTYGSNSLITGSIGDSRYKPLYSTTILNSSNNTATLSDVIKVSLAANTVYYIEVVAACSFSGTVGNTVQSNLKYTGTAAGANGIMILGREGVNVASVGNQRISVLTLAAAGNLFGTNLSATTSSVNDYGLMTYTGTISATSAGDLSLQTKLGTAQASDIITNLPGSIIRATILN